ncbi:amidase [Paenibacillus sp. FJAT-26967]|uniref:amidase n=1 Tax=Paenibacillus sp. FJAT-26967 TaxID=1729690 RepID=UPI000837C56A|nr:amidase family protein [Paenibacillus sp. FJAT-26967]
MAAELGLLSLSAAKMARGIREGRWTSRELVELHIQRIEGVNPELCAVVVPMFDEARRQSDAADLMRASGQPLPPLHGVPVTIKESIDAAGTPSTWGLPSRSGMLAQQDDPSVAALRQAGAILLGKTNVMQLLMGCESVNPVYGRSRNPWRPEERTPGGSSGGEAAIIAAGGSPLGLGTDVGGSIRTPALFCGIHGLKPTPGRVPAAKPAGLYHLRPAAAAMASTGPMARHVEDLTLALEIVSAQESLLRAPIRSSDSRDIRRLRIGYYTTDGILAPSASLQRAVNEAVALLEGLGIEVKEFKLPDLSEAVHHFYGLISAAGAEGIAGTAGTDTLTGQLVNIRRSFGLTKGARRFVVPLLRLLGQQTVGAHILPYLGLKSEEELQTLVHAQQRFRQNFMKEMDRQGVDVLLSPAALTPAIAHDHSLTMSYEGSYGLLYNYLGMPAGVLSTSCVRSEETDARQTSRDRMIQSVREAERGSLGLPVGVQVAASPWREDQVLAVMSCLEEQVKNQTDYPVGKIIRSQ